MKYISQPPLLLDVHIHKPLLPARTWMDSLLAFFPGLQVGSQSVAAPGAAARRTTCHLLRRMDGFSSRLSGVEGRHSSGDRDP